MSGSDHPNACPHHGLRECGCLFQVQLTDDDLATDGGTSVDGAERSPRFIERGERPGDGSGWDYYECPDCGDPICSFCDCPSCGWYDADGWNASIRAAARDRDDVYTGSLEVGRHV